MDGRTQNAPAIQRLTLGQFSDLLRSATGTLTRKVDSVHLHHTWRPRRSDFRGLPTIEAMRRFHMDQGWNDIAQHLTIDPQGGLWTGRNWNDAPASQKGKNGDAAKGPFMLTTAALLFHNELEQDVPRQRRGQENAHRPDPGGR